MVEIIFILLVILVIISTPDKYHIFVLVGVIIASAKYICNTNKPQVIEKFEGITSEDDNDDDNESDNESDENMSNEKFDATDIVNELFDEKLNAVSPGDGDSRLGARMQYIQQQSKDAILHRSRMTSDNFRKFYQEELDAAEKRHWWEHDDLDNFMIKDDINWNSL